MIPWHLIWLLPLLGFCSLWLVVRLEFVIRAALREYRYWSLRRRRRSETTAVMFSGLARIGAAGPALGGTGRRPVLILGKSSSWGPMKGPIGIMSSTISLRDTARSREHDRL